MLIRYLYTILFYLALPIIVLRLLWKSRKNIAYRQRMAERFGYIDKKVLPNGIWIHAVSVGEVIAAVPLIKRLQQQYAHLPIVITTMTPTGAERVHTTFGETVTHLYLPYDISHFVQKFLAKVQPRLAIFIETELWPNLLQACANNNISVAILNARLSAKSAAGYQKVKYLTQPMLQQINLLAAQNAMDGERFIALGLPRECLHITGSMKFDLELPPHLLEQAQQLRLQWGEQRPVWIAASTHAGEEEIILKTFVKLRAQLPTLVLILVPRHLERFAAVANLCKQFSRQVVLRSSQTICMPDMEILLGDTMGELLLLYACADIAFVGGSLVNKGGHNPLEPAALGLPILVGEHMFNFAVITQQLIEAGALIKVPQAEELENKILTILQDKHRYQQMREAGLKVMAENRGALEKQLALLKQFLT